MKRILWSLLILLTLAVAGCGYSSSISGKDGGSGSVSGYVNYTIPIDGDTGIGTFSSVTVVFNQPMKVLDVTSDSAYSVICDGETKQLQTPVYDAVNQAVKLETSTAGGWGQSNVCTVTLKGAALRDVTDKQMGENYSFTFSTASDTLGTIAAIDLSASKLTLETDGSDSIDFTVYAKNASNSAAAGATITVESTAGFLSTGTVTTGANGQATFTLGVGSEKANGQIGLTLTGGEIVKTQTIMLAGTTLALSSSKLATTPGDTTPIELTATLRDAAAQPISGAPIAFSSALENTFTPLNGYTFTEGSTGKTDSAGLFKVKYRGTNAGIDTVTVASSGATASTKLTSNEVSQAYFGFKSPADQSVVEVNTPVPLTVEWINADGSKAANKVLTFSVNKGYFGDRVIPDPPNLPPTMNSLTTATTNAAGVATLAVTDFNAYYTGVTAGPATISVSDSSGIETATLTLQVHAKTPTMIDVQVTPGVIPVSTPTTSATATVKATVRDAKNQAVAGKVVVFTIISGPGAGEFINPVTAITNDSGIATSTFTSGGGASAEKGVVLQATVQGVAPAQTKMTIAQKAATVAIGTTNKLESMPPTSYKQPFTVLVTNSSGAAVAGAPVTLSLVPKRFYTGGWLSNEFGILTLTTTGLYATEDANRNYILDIGEDCAPQLDMERKPTGKYWQDGTTDLEATIKDSLAECTGNQKLDPGAVASIDPTVTTGQNGMATFYVYYPKSSGNWVDVEITATTDVTGTNASAKIETHLAVLVNDIPYLSSPFGVER